MQLRIPFVERILEANANADTTDWRIEPVAIAGASEEVRLKGRGRGLSHTGDDLTSGISEDECVVEVLAVGFHEGCTQVDIQALGKRPHPLHRRAIERLGRIPDGLI